MSGSFNTFDTGGYENKLKFLQLKTLKFGAPCFYSAFPPVGAGQLVGVGPEGASGQIAHAGAAGEALVTAWSEHSSASLDACTAQVAGRSGHYPASSGEEEL